MMNEAQSSHPSPHRHKVGKLRLAVSLFGAPVAWLGQMLTSEIVSSYACYPHRVPLAAPLSPWMGPLLDLISIMAVFVALASDATCLIAWREIRHEKEERGSVVDTGEGRTRFLLSVGLMASFLFTLSLLFTICALLLIQPCGGGK
jgi:hypothetical protein